eukprot:TRINITY_DN5364_c0_g1_i1.p1 TRINITY_DN5364_c0_g1~~TRINITY_DN5364_c0_g1_i1.p1  ORF type:complete len:305 (+),score=42.71 TRINITY_DN5364_c0_g1_i1:285-1199(+)
MGLIMIKHKTEDGGGIFRSRFQDGLWLIKIPVILIILTISLFLPNKFFYIYSFVALVGGIFFIFIQVVLLVDFAYELNENWVEKEWYRLIVILSAAIYIVSLAGIIAMFVLFRCALHVFFISFTLISSVIYTYLSLREDLNRGSLLTSAVLTGYCTYLCFSAIEGSVTSSQCNPFYHADSNQSPTWLLIVGITIAIASVTWNTTTSASTKGFFDLQTKSEDETLLLSQKRSSKRYNVTFFHLSFACGSMYMAMLFTSWNNADQSQRIDVGPASMWIKITSQWLCILFYFWSLIAPLICRSRDWD